VTDFGIKVGPERVSVTYALLGAVLPEARRRARVDVVSLGVRGYQFGGFPYARDERPLHPAVLAGRPVTELDVLLRSQCRMEGREVLTRYQSIRVIFFRYHQISCPCPGAFLAVRTGSRWDQGLAGVT
jgi:hypothetical protein